MFPTLTQIKWVLIGVSAVAMFGGGFYLGDSLKQAAWDAVKVKEQEETQKILQAAYSQVIETERGLQKKMVDQSQNYQKKLQEKDREKASAIDHASSDGLWVDVAPQGCKDGVPDSTASTGGHNAETRARLSDSSSRALIELASEANKVVEQLTSCQQILEVERNDQLKKD